MIQTYDPRKETLISLDYIRTIIDKKEMGKWEN